jgi:hypothetical protein
MLFLDRRGDRMVGISIGNDVSQDRQKSGWAQLSSRERRPKLAFTVSIATADPIRPIIRRTGAQACKEVVP